MRVNPPDTRHPAAHYLLAVIAVAGAAGLCRPAGAQEGGKPSYQSMAPLAQYRMASPAEEIALARSAAPASISRDAEILVLSNHGYETAVKGKNGFVCLVERSWFAPFTDSGFWNPTIRGPDCLNAAAASTVLPGNLERTQWVLVGLSKAEMLARTKTSTASRQAPAAGSMGYMMSKQQHLSDADGHWHPHLMFFLPRTTVSSWGANLPGSPVMGQEGGPNEPTIFFVPMAKWSDGTTASMDVR
jgi:hypothetical protein